MVKQQFGFEYLFEIASQFLGVTPISDIESYGKGAINDSFRVVTEDGSFLLQRVNAEYFPEPLKLLANFKAISSCRDNLQGLSAIKPQTGNLLWYKDGQGSYWRMYNFFDHSYSCTKISNIFQSYEIAKAYGQYMLALSVLPLESMSIVVDEFHNTMWRYEQLLLAEQQDKFGRVIDCRQEIDFVKSKFGEIMDFSELLDGDIIPQRVVHNDTGIDNVLLDKATGAAIAVIDWDTTMPGYSLWDFGDMFRSALGVEYDESISATQCFESLLSGYLAGTGSLLLPEEVIHFPNAGRIISLELGIRYLIDYLSGDPVFKYSDGASLLRARKSFLRYKIMLFNDSQFRQIIDRALSVYSC